MAAFSSCLQLPFSLLHSCSQSPFFFPTTHRHPCSASVPPANRRLYSDGRLSRVFRAVNKAARIVFCEEGGGSGELEGLNVGFRDVCRWESARAHHRKRELAECRAQIASSEVVAEMENSSAGAYGALSQVCAVLGTQWGDEGKGKLVDILSQQYDVVARCQGGANAGHTIYNSKGQKFALHVIPSGILNEHALCVIGNGVVVHLPGFFEEVERLESNGVICKGRLIISDRSHLLLDLHQTVDSLREEELAGSKIGTTKHGIGPCYAGKAIRNGLRVCDLRHMDTFKDKLAALFWDASCRFEGFKYDDLLLNVELERYKVFAERVEPYIADTVHYINEAYRQKKRILVEGGQATMLDVDFGTYPFVTSSNPSAGGICTGLGLAPKCIGDVIGVVKAYCTRVGQGPFPTELPGQDGDTLRTAGYEYGTTTGRPRRCGWMDIAALDYSCQINGFSVLNLTKLDVLSALPQLKLGVAYRGRDGRILPSFPADLKTLGEVEVRYEEMPGWQVDISTVRKYKNLPAAAQAYVERIESLVGVPIRYIGVGPSRDALIVKD
eukprot:c18638_g1_i1 orf=340-2001(-)